MKSSGPEELRARTLMQFIIIYVEVERYLQLLQTHLLLRMSLAMKATHSCVRLLDM